MSDMNRLKAAFDDDNEENEANQIGEIEDEAKTVIDESEEVSI